MKKALYLFAMVASFFVLLPLSWRLADSLVFTRPFEDTSFDPVLLVCPDHVEVLRLRELVGSGSTARGCTFQVSRSEQPRVERAIKQLQSPAPTKFSWTLKVQQLGQDHQRIDLALMGNGITGMIYDVRNERISPLHTRLTGPLGSIVPLGIEIVLWVAVWLTVWLVLRHRRPSKAVH